MYCLRNNSWKPLFVAKDKM